MRIFWSTYSRLIWIIIEKKTKFPHFRLMCWFKFPTHCWVGLKTDSAFSVVVWKWFFSPQLPHTQPPGQAPSSGRHHTHTDIHSNADIGYRYATRRKSEHLISADCNGWLRPACWCQIEFEPTKNTDRTTKKNHFNSRQLSHGSLYACGSLGRQLNFCAWKSLTWRLTIASDRMPSTPLCYQFIK